MAAVVFTPTQIQQIANHFVQTQWVTPNQTAIAGTDQLISAIQGLATSISIGGGTVSYSLAFAPPLNNLTTNQQAALLCYIIQQAMGVPLS